MQVRTQRPVCAADRIQAFRSQGSSHTARAAPSYQQLTLGRLSRASPFGASTLPRSRRSNLTRRKVIVMPTRLPAVYAAVKACSNELCVAQLILQAEAGVATAAIPLAIAEAYYALQHPAALNMRYADAVKVTIMSRHVLT